MTTHSTGLADGQSWNIPAGPLWQARLWTDGRAHVIGQALAEHPRYAEGYATGSDYGLTCWTTFKGASDAAHRHNATLASRGGAG